MGKVRADQKNYKKAFSTHLHAYKEWKMGCDNSKRLLLFYCVECGLKCLIMQDYKISKFSQASEEIQSSLGSHDIKRLLKEVGQAGNYRFKSFQSEYNDTITIETYHQLCRYHVGLKNDDISPVRDMEEMLYSIAKWLEESIA